MQTNPTHKDDVSDALALLGELLDGPSKGAFYGIDASLRSKLETIRLTLNRAQPGGLVEAAVNQNDAMRQELAHIGNLVSDLARAMRVDQANDDGSWPDLAGGIDKLKQAALASSDSPAIPAGMKPWHGGDHAPDDWDGGDVLLGCGQMGDGNVWDHHPSRKPGHIIAYTPKPTPTDDDTVAVLVEALKRAVIAADNLHGELEAHQENTGEDLDPEDQAVVFGAMEDVAFARFERELSTNKDETIAKLRALVERARDQFLYYEKQHIAKTLPGGQFDLPGPSRDSTLAKAEVNRALAAEMTAALTSTEKEG